MNSPLRGSAQQPQEQPYHQCLWSFSILFNFLALCAIFWLSLVLIEGNGDACAAGGGGVAPRLKPVEAVLLDNGENAFFVANVEKMVASPDGEGREATSVVAAAAAAAEEGAPPPPPLLESAKK